MSLTLQVLYPATDGTTFDFDYYTSKHMKIVADTIGPQIEDTVIVRGQPGPDGAISHHVIASILFADQASFEAAKANIKPAAEDIANFYNGTPQIVYGERLG